MTKVNPLHYIMYLVLGCIGFIFSFLLIVHTICIHYKPNGKPVSLLLNNMYIVASDRVSPVFAIMIWLMMCFYLLICVIMGNIDISGFFTSFIGVQQFKVNGTWMTSFLVNCMMMLVSSFGMLSYITLEFETFLRGSAVEKLWRVVLINVRGIKYIYLYKINSYFFVFWFFLVTAYLLTLSSKKSKITKLMREKKSQRMKD